MGFEGNPSTLNLGTVGTGFTNDSFPPEPMGLTSPVNMVIGDDNWMVQFTYGIDGSKPSGSTIATDNAVLMQWNGVTAVANKKTQIFRTSYGTNEFCTCMGNVIALNIFPTHQLYSPHSNRYAPSAFPVLSMMINTTASPI